MIVVDVTVLAAYVMRGEDTDSVVALRKRHPDWAAPQLWKSEFMNVVWKYARRGDIATHQAVELMDTAMMLMCSATFDVPPEDVLTLSCQFGCSAYDGQYVVLAKRLDVSLATHDQQLLRMFPDIAFLPADVPDQGP
ncbi:MAG: VapC toxin family PIN domain ribonuclease [Bacteroidetes bacterium CG12_big_fil_rev_8_21_14_0_65_60_17]|nr:MAG: VapC toxin family PIN domain ribonuclease [Bacteroidetes bacterium CG12_big_fil_rev_8_21_14_0_65_60_17]